MATQVEELRERARNLDVEYRAEVAKFSEANLPSVEDEARLEAMVNARADIADKIAEESGRLSRFQTLVQGLATDGDPAPRVVRSTEIIQRPASLSLGQRFTQNADFQNWLKANATAEGRIPETAKGLHSPPMSFKGLTELDMLAALLTGESSTSAGAFVTPQYYPGLTELGRRPLTIRDLITVLQTTSDAIEYVRITTETNAAAPVAEATAAAGGSGVKPESTLAFERVSTPVKTIAHWIPATKRAISDASQLRGLIDAFLRYGLDEELEDQIVVGNGVGENLTGILNTTGRQSQAWTSNILTTTRQARRKVLTVGRRRPNAYIMHPIDWEGIDLLQDNEARYFFGGPAAIGTPRLWGLPVAETEAITQGVGIVGDLTTCVLWDREDSSISVSDSHSDFFIRNLIAILAELRAAFGILKPNALVEIDLVA